MKNFEDKMKNIGTGVQLTTSEKEVMRTQVREYMAYTPNRSDVPEKSFRMTVLSYRFSAVLVVIALLFTSGIGVTYASTNALPGDRLYVVKEAQEEITERLIVNDEKRTEYAIERTYKRLQEVEALAVRGTLDEEMEERVTKRFRQLEQRAQEHLAFLGKEKPEEAKALRVALSVGIEARTEFLAIREARIDDKDNNARVRIARAIAFLPINEQVDKDESATRVLAIQTGVRAENIERSGDFKKSEEDTDEDATVVYEIAATQQRIPEQASVLPREVQGGKISPVMIAKLTQTLSKQKRKLEKKLKASKIPREKKNIEEVLKKIVKMQTEITDAIRAGNRARAQKLIREALRTVHKTLISLKMRDEPENKEVEYEEFFDGSVIEVETSSDVR